MDGGEEVNKQSPFTNLALILYPSLKEIQEKNKLPEKKPKPQSIYPGSIPSEGKVGRPTVYRAPRGTLDILPREQAYWRYLEQKAVNVCQLYGYERIDAPAFEDTSLFARSVGEETDIVTKEMYTFEDKGGNKLTLRPEGTAPVCRAYLEHGLHNLPQPVKLYYFASIFRYERPQAGRYREHHQFGYEAIGDNDPALDAEVIDMAWQLFQSLGLHYLSLQLNSIGCKKCQPQYLAALKDYYADYARDLCSDCKTRLRRNPLRLLDCKQPLCQQIANTAPCRSCISSKCFPRVEYRSIFWYIL